MTHEIKLLESYCDAVLSGEKNFEVRKNDRGYQKGDHVSFIPVDKDFEAFYHPISEKEYVITYVHSGLGLQNEYVVFGIKDVNKIENDTPIENVGFSRRCYCALKRNGIDTVGQLDNYTMDSLTGLKYIGKATAFHIMKELEWYKER